MNTATPDPGSAATSGPAGTTSLPTYAPGECNIGEDEIRVRRQGAIAAGVGALVLWGILAAVDAPPILRLIVGIPAGAAAISALQVRNRFCVAFAMQGLENVSGSVGEAIRIVNPEDRQVDRRRASRMVAVGAVVGVATGVVAAVLG